MSSPDPKNLNNPEKERELEIRRMVRESTSRKNTKLKKTEQKTTASAQPKLKSPITSGLIFCLMFLPPVGIIMAWFRKGIHPLVKILLTLFGLLTLAIWLGWIYLPHEPWHMFFLFTGQ